jgi:hypothetical protein
MASVAQFPFPPESGRAVMWVLATTLFGAGRWGAGRAAAAEAGTAETASVVPAMAIAETPDITSLRIDLPFASSGA